MSLLPGARLGPYEILGPLGAGGMGEVYRARDPRLARDVAVKVLPEGLTQDSERLRRFEQEARAAGALNHPNVLAVFDTGRHDGSPYVVSELLEGQTLRERLAGAGLPVRKAVEIATQIARGLAAAHEKGIVHRDLKPENVFVSKDGHVKILDFGLAKLTHHAGDPEDSGLPTRTRETDPGTVMGTAGYMSPEQVRGEAVDHRSDIFSFGAILYEALSGRRAFKGETTAETMAAILKEDPPDLSATNKALPPALDRIVRHCLEKSPEERFASARDLAFDLQALSDASAPAAKAMRRRAAFGMKGVAVGLVWTLGVAGAAFWLGQTTSERPSPSYRALTFRRGALNAARFSGDGTYFIYSAAWEGGASHVYSTRLDVPGEQALLGGRLAGVAAGEMLVLRSDGVLLRAPLSGAGAREVAEGVKAADLSRDGSRTAVVRRRGAKERLESPPGTMLYEAAGEISELRFSPDGSRVAIIEWPNAGWSFGQVKVIDFERNERTLTPVRLVHNLVWSPDARELWFGLDAEDGYALRAVSLTGRERLLMRTANRPALLDVVEDGRVLLDLSDSRLAVAGLEPSQTLERDLSWQEGPEAYDLTADGRMFVFCIALPPVTYLGRLDGTPPVRLGDGCPTGISPDGRWVAATDAGGNALSLLPTGPGEIRRPAAGTVRYYFDIRWLPDSRRILFAGSEQGRPRRLFLQDVDSGPPQAVTPEGISTDYAFPSPDGRWVAAGSDWHQSPYALYPLDGGEPRPIPGLERGEQPLRFDADGSHLFVWVGERPDVLAARVVRLDLRNGHRDPWREISPADPAGFLGINYIYLTPDGRGHLYNYKRRLSTLYLVEGLR
jgi:hypothetical protein